MITRRSMIQLIALAGGGVVSGWANPDLQRAPTSFTRILVIHPDNRATITSPAAEMGQDVLTGLAKILADEIGLDWSDVTVAVAPYHQDFASERGQSTGDSRSIRSWYGPLRRLGAAVRFAFLQAAAHHWGVAVESCDVAQSRVTHRDTGREATLVSLAEAAARLPLLENPPLKAAGELTLIGRAVFRKDTPPKVDGTARFGADVRLPGQLYAAIAMPPTIDGKLNGYDDERARDLSGVVGVYQLGEAIAVVADGWWRASQALKFVDSDFSPGAHQEIDDAAIDEILSRRVDASDGLVANREGDPDRALAQGEVIEARYDTPYLAHACMEPMVATVSVEKHRVVAYMPTQSPQRCAMRLARLTERPLAQIEMHNTFVGGGFGRKGLDFQVLDQATELSQRLGKPVQVMWDRETDTRQDQFRPIAKYRYRGTLTAQGNIDAVDLRVATQSLRRARFPDYYDPARHELLDDHFVYRTNARRHVWSEAELPLRIGYWRAVWHSNHPFAAESFVDELAAAAGEDPYRFRRRHLSDRPRTLAALDAVAELAQWDRKRSHGYGIGIAVQEGWDSVCAQVAEVSITDQGKLVVHDVWAAVDCGLAIAPNSVLAQIEGGIVFALSAALMGRVRVRGGAIVEGNFSDYPLLTLREAPRIHVTILESSRAPGGVGELGVPPCAPAVANALYAAAGYRARSLPLRDHEPLHRRDS